jgi:hypothetical protein
VGVAGGQVAHRQRRDGVEIHRGVVALGGTAIVAVLEAPGRVHVDAGEPLARRGQCVEVRDGAAGLLRDRVSVARPKRLARASVVFVVGILDEQTQGVPQMFSG